MSEDNTDDDDFDLIMNTMMNIITRRTVSFVDSYYDNFLYEDDENLERALIESLEMQPTLSKKTDVKVDFKSENFDSEKMKENNSCCICLNNYNKKSIVVNIPSCNHIIHKKCLEEWITYKDECPICRTKINIDLYLKK